MNQEGGQKDEKGMGTRIHAPRSPGVLGLVLVSTVGGGGRAWLFSAHEQTERFAKGSWQRMCVLCSTL